MRDQIDAGNTLVFVLLHFLSRGNKSMSWGGFGQGGFGQPAARPAFGSAFAGGVPGPTPTTVTDPMSTVQKGPAVRVFVRPSPNSSALEETLFPATVVMRSVDEDTMVVNESTVKFVKEDSSFQVSIEIEVDSTDSPLTVDKRPFIRVHSQTYTQQEVVCHCLGRGASPQNPAWIGRVWWPPS